MTLTNQELSELASRLQNDYCDTTLALASLAHLGESWVRQLPGSQAQTAVLLRRLHCRCIAAYADQQRIPVRSVVSAFRDIDRAGLTAKIISTIPD